MRFLRHLVLGFILFTSSAAVAQTFDANALRPLGYHPSTVTYYNVPYFADALAQSGEWLSFLPGEFGTPVDIASSQFDANGLPLSLQGGRMLRAILFGLNADYAFRPAGWPSRTALTRGKVVVTWKGNGDVRLVRCRFVPSESSGAETGSLVDGRRVYLCTASDESVQSLEVHALTTPLSELHVWLPRPDDPATPQNESELASLEDALFHPTLLARIADTDWGFIRFMDWGSANASPQRDWIDRRLPSHIFKTGILNRRSPGGGSDGDRETGVSFEEMVALCNRTGRHLWINVPHLATDDFVSKLAQLIRFGSDGRNPYTSTQADPVFPPLRSDLRLFVEYSNEIWSNGFSFPQGDWAEAEAASRGISRAQFNARRFCDTWRTFQQIFGGHDRLVRVAATFTALESYSTALLTEIGSYGPSLNPSVRPDVLAMTTYFGNGMQDFVQAKRFADGKLFDDPYWQSATFTAHKDQAFDEWTRRLLAGDATQGSGFDSTGIGGGFSATLRDLPSQILGYPLPLVAYEGGPSLYTDNIDSNASNSDGVPTDDFITTFIEAMNRDPRISSVYDIHLNLAKQKGLRTHTPFTDAGVWSKFGQWGHLETFDQPPAAAPKYALMLAHAAEFAAIRPVDAPLASVPAFSTGALMPAAVVGQAYSQTIPTSGGDRSRNVKIVGTFLDPALSATVNGDSITISGTPSVSRKNYVHVRVIDGDGDPAWRIFTLETFGGTGTLLQSNFRGTSPALASPWTATHVASPKITSSGWRVNSSSEITAREGDDAFVFSVNGGENDETLSQAIAQGEYITLTITPVNAIDLRNAEVRFHTRRVDFHSARMYALGTSLGGFSEGAMHYVSVAVGKDDFGEIEHLLRLPSTEAFAAVSSPLEFRVYAAGAQFDGHRSSLTGFKLTTTAARGRTRPVRRQ